MSDTYPFADVPLPQPRPQNIPQGPAAPPVAAPAVAPQAPPDPGIMQQWNDALGDPTVRASLLQFGISMLQPPSWGDNTLSQAGRAIGDTGEAQARRDEEARKQQDTESKTTLREARATAAESRAREAGAGLDVKKSQVELGQQRLTLSEAFQKQRRHRDAVNAYNTMTKLLPFGSTPPSFQDWAKKNGFGDVANGPYDSGGSNAATVDVNEAKRQGIAAIKARPDLAEAIRNRYRDSTGQEPDF